MKATVTGTKQLSAKLKSLSVDMQKNLERALTVGALVIQNRAKANAPVVTGNLRRSIHIGGHEDLAPDYTGTNSGAAAVPSPEVAADSATVYVGTNLEYAAIQEFGGTITPKKAKALVFEVDHLAAALTDQVVVLARVHRLIDHRPLAKIRD